MVGVGMSDINIDDTMCRRPPVTLGAGREASKGDTGTIYRIFTKFSKLLDL